MLSGNGRASELSYGKESDIKRVRTVSPIDYVQKHGYWASDLDLRQVSAGLDGESLEMGGQRIPLLSMLSGDFKHRSARRSSDDCGWRRYPKSKAEDTYE